MPKRAENMSEPQKTVLDCVRFVVFFLISYSDFPSPMDCTVLFPVFRLFKLSYFHSFSLLLSPELTIMIKSLAVFYSCKPHTEKKTNVIGVNKEKKMLFR